jgi:hypothetical protein
VFKFPNLNESTEESIKDLVRTNFIYFTKNTSCGFAPCPAPPSTHDPNFETAVLLPEVPLAAGLTDARTHRSRVRGSFAHADLYATQLVTRAFGEGINGNMCHRAVDPAERISAVIAERICCRCHLTGIVVEAKPAFLNNNDAILLTYDEHGLVVKRMQPIYFYDAPS